MINELTKEQKLNIKKYFDIYMQKGLSCEDLSEDRQKEIIEKLYEKNGFKKPLVLFMQSPFGCLCLTKVLKNFKIMDLKNIGQNIWRNIEQNIWRNIWRNIEQNIEQNIWQNIEQNIWRNIWRNIGQNIGQNIGRNIEHIWRNIEQNIEQNIGQNIWRNIEQNIEHIWRNIWRNIEQNIEQNIGQNIGQNIEHIWQNIWRNIEQNIEQNIGQNIWQNIAQNIGQNIGQNIEQNIGQNIRQNIGQNIEQNIGQNIKRNIGQNIEHIWRNIWRNIGENIGQNIEIENFWYGQHNANWQAYYSYFHDNFNYKVKDEEYYNIFISLCDMHWFLPFENICILSKKPKYIKLNKQGRLHNENGMVIEYGDGYGFYALNGVRMPENLVLTSKEKLDCNLFYKIENVEQRQEFVRKVGLNRLAKELNFDIIDKINADDLYQQKPITNYIQQGDKILTPEYENKVDYKDLSKTFKNKLKNIWYELINIKIKEEYRPYLKMNNASLPEDLHIEGVNISCKNVFEAICWRNKKKSLPCILS